VKQIYVKLVCDGFNWNELVLERMKLRSHYGGKEFMKFLENSIVWETPCSRESEK
jgi:hypothetical protein